MCLLAYESHVGTHCVVLSVNQTYLKKIYSLHPDHVTAAAQKI